MEAPLLARFLVYLLTFKSVTGSLLDITHDSVNKESSPLIDNGELQSQFELLNSAVKRQTKGSCSCTCETLKIA